MDAMPTLIRTQKLIKRKRKANSIVREQYLREDIKCHSPICEKCVSHDGKDLQIREMFLSKEASHYVIPTYDIFQNYLEIIEIPEISGIIILQSLASKVLQSSGRGSYRRLLNISRDTRRGSAVFLNEICISTNIERLPSFSDEEWLIRSVLKVAEYYSDHLKCAIPIFVVTEDLKAYSNFQHSEIIKIIALKNYLETMWGDVTHAIDLYDSISSSLSLSMINDSSKLYESYLPQEILHSGIKAGRYLRGTLRVNKHVSSHEAYISSSQVVLKDSGDILVHGMIHRNRAIHGDEVVVELLPKTEWKSKCLSLISTSDADKENINETNLSTAMPTGKVVGVLERKWRSYVATLPAENEETKGAQRSNNERILVVPYDYRIPKIRIATNQAEKLRNQRIIVRIDCWEKDSQYPNGHFVKTLGEVGLLETEVQSLLVEHNVCTSDFPQSLFAELPQCNETSPWAVSEEEVQKRRDLRQSHLIFSIDPKGSEDVDDALSVRELPNGLLELGVHIADVTYFVQSSSLTDLEAQSRSTSVYLPDRRYAMLPHVLSENLCSLLGNVDRYAVSAIWNLDSNMEVQEVWFGRTIIRSRYKLCYEDAQDICIGQSAIEMKEKILELQNLDEDKLNQRFKELRDAVFKLLYLSRTLRSKRLASGGLELDNINMKLEIDKTLPSVISEFKIVKDLEVQKMVAECMIFANHWVSKKIVDSFPQQSVLRRHPHPRKPDLEELKQLASSKGFSFNINSNNELSHSLDKAVDPQNPAVNQIFRILATRSMNEATYFCTGCFPPEEYCHYGLGIPRYTHFTSPIRRYADVLVHRLLLASVGELSQTELLKMSDLELLCNHMNERHRAAQDVEKCVQELFQVYFFNDLASQNELKNCLADGVIYAIRSNGVLVYLPQYVMKGAVCLCNKEKKVAVVQEDVEWLPGHLEVKECELTVVSSNYCQTYSVFDHITVQIKVQESRAHQPKINLELFSNETFEPTISISSDTSIKNEAVTAEQEIVASPSKDYGTSSGEENDQKENLYSMLNRFRNMTLLIPS